MRKLALAVAIVSLGAVALIATAVAKNRDGGDNGRSFSAKLIGYEEDPSVSTLGRGSFTARIREDPLRIDYRLRYENLQGDNTLFAHIHLGDRHTNGGISAFLCDEPTNPPSTPGIPDCTDTNGDITGTIEANEVIGPVPQGITAGELTELIRAMRAGVTYANVHTAPPPPATTPPGDGFPGGEIRGQIDHGRHFKFVVRGKGKKDDD
jgi:CHRD domain